METKQRPTTVDAVEEHLKAKARYYPSDAVGKVHYMLGMCMMMLAEANAHIERMERGERVR